jgi:phasin family protein
MNPPQAEFLDLYRSGLKNAADLMKASLESAERLQQQQLAAIRGALEQNAKALSELGNAKSLDDLMALQQKMAGAQFERVMGYWSSLCQTTGESQVATISKQMAQARDWFNESYTLTARAAEEAGKMPGAGPDARAAAGVRQQQASKQEKQERRTA